MTFSFIRNYRHHAVLLGNRLKCSNRNPKNSVSQAESMFISRRAGGSVQAGHPQMLSAGWFCTSHHIASVSGYQAPLHIIMTSEPERKRKGGSSAECSLFKGMTGKLHALFNLTSFQPKLGNVAISTAQSIGKCAHL